MPDFNHPDPYGIGGPVTYEHEDPVYGRLIEIRYEGRAIGQVELYGQIIEGEWGYQAQGAIVRSIYVLKTTPACIVAQLEERYQCEVGLLEPHSFEEVSSDAVDRHEATP